MAAADAAGLLEAPLDEQAATRMMAAMASLANRNRPSVKRIDVLLESLPALARTSMLILPSVNAADA